MNRIGIAALLLCLGVLGACNDQSPTNLNVPAEPPAEADLARLDGGLLQAAFPYAGTIIAVVGSGNIEPALAAIRPLLGEPLNFGVGGDPAGRREINWDAVPPAFTNTNDFPGDFFNATDPDAPAGRKRGALFSTPGTGLRVSDNDFADVNPTYADEFNFFSPVRTFAQIGSRVLDVTFRVPGTDIPAVVNGFAVVFSDVDRHSSGLLFYDVQNRLIAIAPAPVRKDAAGHSLIGAVFDAAVVARVRIVSGERSIGPGVNDLTSGGRHDLVVMDDFLYGEPQAIQ